MPERETAKKRGNAFLSRIHCRRAPAQEFSIPMFPLRVRAAISRLSFSRPGRRSSTFTPESHPPSRSYAPFRVCALLRDSRLMCRFGNAARFSELELQSSRELLSHANEFFPLGGLRQTDSRNFLKKIRAKGFRRMLGFSTPVAAAVKKASRISMLFQRI